jgi:hypothetical protein
MYQTERTFQIKCENCGNVREVHTQGIILESEKICNKCGNMITEQNIQEIKGDFLLE